LKKILSVCFTYWGFYSLLAASALQGAISGQFKIDMFDTDLHKYNLILIFVMLILSALLLFKIRSLYANNENLSPASLMFAVINASTRAGVVFFPIGAIYFFWSTSVQETIESRLNFFSLLSAFSYPVVVAAQSVVLAAGNSNSLASKTARVIRGRFKSLIALSIVGGGTLLLYRSSNNLGGNMQTIVQAVCGACLTILAVLGPSFVGSSLMGTVITRSSVK